MKAVVDTNVLVSGLLKPFGPPGIIVRLLASEDLHIVYDARIISEYRSVLHRDRFGFDFEQVEIFLRFIEEQGITVAPGPLKKHLLDLDDEPFLEAARACPGSVLITGNSRHFPDDLCEGAEVLTPAEFVDRHCRK